MYFSKSKYTTFTKCPKLSWLQKYKSELRAEDAGAQARMQRGNEVGELAKGLLGAYEDVTTLRADGSLDISAMTEKTQRLLSSGAENICEAAFSYNGLYCAVDILHRENGGYAIYEVKSSTKVKDYHYTDVAYQKYVLQKCGIRVTSVHIVTLNSEYVRHGALDVRKLFCISADISSEIAERETRVEETLQYAERVLSAENEPKMLLSSGCAKCEYFGYCSKDVPTPSVLDLYYFSDKWDCYNAGIVTYENLLASGKKLTDMQRRQIEHALHDKGTHIDKERIGAFLSKLSYPLYFLDFETMQVVVPEFDGVHPYDQVPFQYSLHSIEHEGGAIQHREFLASPSGDPRRALAERLCADIGDNACIMAHHASTERGIVEKLGDTFADLQPKLRKIQESIVDLLPVFNKGGYYNRHMGGSFSIKSILPAIYPELDYHNLEDVQNGTEAADIFPRLKYMPPEEAERIVRALLLYCERDTLAMVKVWQELVRVCK